MVHLSKKNAIKKVYSGENNELITNIKYQEKNKLLCMYTDKIELIKADETVEKIQEFKYKKRLTRITLLPFLQKSL